MDKNYFVELNNINVNDKTEKKNGLTYLSWAWAWGEIKKLHPNANYKIYENKDELNYFTDGKTAWVKTGVIVNDIEHIEYLPVMDNRNKSIPLASITSFDVNKAIQRSLTKACARHGLGLYVYAGEDLPENEQDEQPKQEVKQPPKTATKPKQAVKTEVVSVEPNNEPTEAQLQELQALGGSLEVLSDYYGVPTFAITSEQVQAMIDRKKKKLAKEQQKND